MLGTDLHGDVMTGKPQIHHQLYCSDRRKQTTIWKVDNTSCAGFDMYLLKWITTAPKKPYLVGAFCKDAIEKNKQTLIDQQKVHESTTVVTCWYYRHQQSIFSSDFLGRNNQSKWILVLKSQRPSNTLLIWYICSFWK